MFTLLGALKFETDYKRKLRNTIYIYKFGRSVHVCVFSLYSHFECKGENYSVEN